MADQAHGKSPTWFVAIDIGKKAHAVLVEDPGGRRQRFSMANSAEDFDRLMGFLGALPGPVRIALEPTGEFQRTAAYRLLRGVPVVSVSSVVGVRYREAMFNSRDKTDPNDATVILYLLKQGLVQHYHDPPPGGGARALGARQALSPARPWSCPAHKDGTSRRNLGGAS